MKVNEVYKLSEKQQLAYFALHLKESPYTRVLYGGAAGGGKTLLGCIFQLTRRLDYPETRGAIGRKYREDLMGSTFKTFQQVYHKLAYPRIGPMKYNGQTNMVSFPNGSEIKFMYLVEKPGDPEFNRFGSTEYTDAFVDEAVECSESSINVLYTRIRHNLINDKEALLLTSNPGYGWLKNNWIEDPSGVKAVLPEKWKYIQAKVTDNPDTKFRDKYIETLSELPEYHRLRLLDGDWNYQINDSPYYPEYNINCIVDNLEFRPDKPIIIACDFNYSPGTAVLLQNYEGYINFIKVLQADGGTINVANKLLDYFNIIDWKGSFRLTGDSSGHKRDTRAGVETDYKILMKALKIPEGWVNYTNRSNMALDRSRDLMNLAFYNKIIRISRNGCPELIQDLNIAKPLNDKTAEFKKDRERYKMDVLDAARYGFHYIIKNDQDVRMFKQINK